MADASASNAGRSKKSKKSKKTRKSGKSATDPVRDPLTGVWRDSLKEEACANSKDGGLGFFGELTDEQWEKLVEVRELTAKEVSEHDWARTMYHDVLRTRFLRARKWDVQKASAMLLADIAWRNDFLGDYGHCRQTYRENWSETDVHRSLIAYWPSNFHGFDLSEPNEEARMPVYWERLTELHSKSLCAFVSLDDFKHFHAFIQEGAEMDREERMVRLNRFLDKEVQTYLVQDIRNLGMAHFYKPALDMVGAAGEMDDNHYAESLKALDILGVTRIFQIFWKVLKGFFDPATRAKMDFIRSDTVAFEKLKKVVGTDYMCDYLPGSTCGPHRHDGSPCLPAGGVFVLDVEATDQNDASSADDESGSDENGSDENTFTIAAGAQEERKVVVMHGGAKLVWDCSVDSHDIHVSLHFEDKAGSQKASNSSEDEPLTRNQVEDFGRLANTSDDPFVGESLAEKQGTYVFIFDNSYSWTRKKEVTFTVGVVEPPKPKTRTKHKNAKKRNHRRKK